MRIGARTVILEGQPGVLRATCTTNHDCAVGDVRQVGPLDASRLPIVVVQDLVLVHDHPILAIPCGKEELAEGSKVRGETCGA